MNITAKATLRYRMGFIRDGKRHFVTPWKANLILDSGLNAVAESFWANMFTYCLFGDQVSPTPVARSSGAVTTAQAGTVITASGNFFDPTDTGRLYKADSGEECYITYVSATVATASISRTVASGPGTVWYVNQTALESLFQTTHTYGATGGDNGTTYVGAVQTMKRTFTGTPVVGPVTLTEIGFNYSATNSGIFDRDIITGGVGLIAGDIPLAVAELIVNYTQTTSAPVGNVGTGYDTSGDFQLVCFRLASGDPNVADVATDGGSFQGAGDNVLEPYYNSTLGVYTATFSIPAFVTGDSGALAAGADSDTNVRQGYSAGNFYRDVLSTFNISTAVGTIYGVALRRGSPGWVQKFTTPFAKAGTQTLKFVTRKSWQRVLTN